MRQSNVYVVVYAAILTVVCGVLLAATAIGLKPKQQENIELERKKNILTAVGLASEGTDIAGVYNSQVNAYVVDAKGNKVEGMVVTDVDVAMEYKKPAAERLLPVYEIKSATNPEEIVNYVLPLYGYGLWDNIWGYVALEKDLNTIKGVTFDHRGETAGLGARIATEEIQERYVGKKIYSTEGELVSVTIMKGENGGGERSLEAYKGKDHQIDGMSGATITGKGVNEMLSDYLKMYDSFFKSNQSSISSL
ncbi:NADH:ubiquinone reductase (Na(+)-transporting) subunit C [Cytophagales bacterium LB-30]|uniref:Na(+)-translocating NADH-quinone reductase subunit C n=1 Tax=Shiella aurantiaca TaxID=3058365 RepID=A0ABT8F819_9BACT|nr:NADH:ubiquinone reductase (Na(+)-transporting) subunit C [Shiella aurantiaca]MDN4166538.1 NADH:ubiquinone reductase (Na(+)-transporting) subunit C [Shiella aurantiaca]